jgi:hypothetical protein
LIPKHLAEEYAPTLQKARELRSQGMTLEEVTAELNRLGFRTRSGKPFKNYTQVGRLLRSFAG